MNRRGSVRKKERGRAGGASKGSGRSPRASYGQEGIWNVEQAGRSCAAYQTSMSLRLVGELDVRALQSSLKEVLRRHEGLRTHFEWRDGSAVQVIEEGGEFELGVEDLSQLAESERSQELMRLCQEEAQRRFDLSIGPLFRAGLLRLSEKEHVLLLTLHHIIADGWSMGILARELGMLYGAYCQGQVSPLAEPQLQYVDYALWQRGWLQGELLQRQLGYWKEQLAGAPAALEMPTDHPRPATASFKGGAVRFELGKELTGQLKGLAREHGATLFMVLLGAYQVLLSRWSGQSDVLVGSPIAGRTHRQTEGLIGLFVNTLVFRLQIGEGEGFGQLLRRVKESALDAYAHQDIPFERLVAELQPVRDLSRQPIFQVFFTLQNVPQEQMQLPGLQVQRLAGRQVSSKFDLSLTLEESEGKLRGRLEYATDLFEEATVERFAGHYERLLRGIVADVDGSVQKLPLLSEAEREQVLVRWNETAAPYPKDRCIHSLFEDQVQRTPDAVAVVYEDQQLTYRQLNEQANQLAHYLIGRGVRPDDRVGICAERGLEMMVGLLGILKAGGAYVPLDPSYPRERLRYMLSDSAPVLVLSTPGAGDVLGTEVLDLRQDRQLWAMQPLENPAPTGLASTHLAYVIYTSGSTGRPKGVMVEHRHGATSGCSTSRV